MKKVINGGNTDTEKFQQFVDYCCDAFNILREEQSLILSLFAMVIITILSYILYIISLTLDGKIWSTKC